MMYQDIYDCICQNIKMGRFIIHHVKPTSQMLFKLRFLKSGLTYRGQLLSGFHHWCGRNRIIL